MMLLTWNNLAYYQSLMAGMRAAIEAGQEFKIAFLIQRVYGGMDAPNTVDFTYKYSTLIFKLFKFISY